MFLLLLLLAEFVQHDQNILLFSFSELSPHAMSSSEDFGLTPTPPSPAGSAKKPSQTPSRTPSPPSSSQPGSKQSSLHSHFGSYGSQPLEPSGTSNLEVGSGEAGSIDVKSSQPSQG